MNNDPNLIGGRDFIACCYEVFLGREVDDVSVVYERGRWPINEALRSFLQSEEFETQIYNRLKTGRPFSPNLHRLPLSAYIRFWVLDRLPISNETLHDILGANSWRELLGYLVMDEQFMAYGPLPALGEARFTETSELLDEPDPFIISATPFDARRYSLVMNNPAELWIQPPAA